MMDRAGEGGQGRRRAEAGRAARRPARETGDPRERAWYARPYARGGVSPRAGRAPGGSGGGGHGDDAAHHASRRRRVRRARGYDERYAARERAYAPYGHDFFGWGAPVPGHGIYPEQHWGGGMIYGLEGAGWAPFGLIGFRGYGYDYTTRRRSPRESRTFGRGGDRALRRWARRRGRRLGPPIRTRGRRRVNRGR